MKAIKQVDYLFDLLPGPKTENWKYTNIKKFLTKDVLLEKNEKADDVDGKKLKKNIISINSPYLILFENGLLNKKKSIVPSGVIIKKIESVKKENHSLHINPKGSGFSNKPKDSFLFKNGEKLDNLLKINNLCNTPTYVVEFEPGFVCDEYIKITSVFQSRRSRLNQQRILFMAHPKSNVKILEQNIDLSECSNFNNSVSEIICLRKSCLEHVIIDSAKQNSVSVKSFFVTQQEKSHSSFYNFSLAGKMSRNNYHVNLNEPQASTNLSGFSCIKNKSHIDNFINVIHSAPNCKSSQLFKNIYKEGSSGVFFGGIFVDKNSQKTKAFQQNNNILLSDSSSVNAIPKLEIFADDVECSHGCTIGQPDFDAVFYLQSRGLRKEDAISILNFAFLNETFKNLSSKELEGVVRNLVLKQLNLKNYS